MTSHKKFEQSLAAEKVRAGLLKMVRRDPCPTLGGAVPPWPRSTTRRNWWFGLHRDGFVYTHHPSHGLLPSREDALVSGTPPTGSDDGATDPDPKPPGYPAIERDDRMADGLFCIPRREALRLRSILRQSRGGSILVTGYRGTGKSSLVNFVVQQLLDEQRQGGELGRAERAGEGGVERAAQRQRRYVPIRINLSSSRTSRALVTLMIQELWNEAAAGRFGDLSQPWVDEIQRVWTDTQRSLYDPDGAPSGKERAAASAHRARHERPTHRNTRASYGLHEAQRALHACLAMIRQHGFVVVFILDELDKLVPRSTELRERTYEEKLREIQGIVAELKFLLTEARAFHIFIAGKDVDDSWQEDQNKGEGLFESVFIQNIYLHSTFTADLHGALGPNRDWIQPKWKRHYERQNPGHEFGPDQRQAWTNALYREVLKEVGISPGDWSYNTGLIVLPHFAENDLKLILLRVLARMVRRQGEQDADRPPPAGGQGCCHDPLAAEWHLLGSAELERNAPWLVPLVADIRAKNTLGPKTRRILEPASERWIRRLRYMLRYLTYKGRGIPRKILREFYALVQDRQALTDPTRFDASYWRDRGEVAHVALLPEPVRQKMKFFSDIVARIEAHPDNFRGLDDKVCVATFHIVDYILKFFQTGFNWADIEFAAFMTQREELFPSREMITRLLDVFEDVLVVRKDRRHRSYMLLPKVRHDLSALYLAFGPEQIELRFTRTDFSVEIARLEKITRAARRKGLEDRLESFKAQVRLGEIYEQLGDHPEARLAYSTGLRWIRADLRRVAQTWEHGFGGIDHSAVMTYVSAAMDLLQRQGYLYELEREFREAQLCYVESVNLHEQACRMLALDERRARDALYGPRRAAAVPSVLSPGPGWVQIDPRQVAGPVAATGRETEVHEKEERAFERMALSMVPDQRNPRATLSPYSRAFNTEKGTIWRQRAFLTPHESRRLPHSINMVALALEKSWYRLAANRYLLLALDHYVAMGDWYGRIDQKILMGEIFHRRRDPSLAAAWYRMALHRVLSSQAEDPTYSRTAKLPEHQSSMRAKLYDHLGDVVFATRGLALVPWRRLASKDSDPPDLPTTGTELRRLRDEMIDELRTLIGAAIQEPRDDEFFYSLAAVHYTNNEQSLRVCDVYLKKLRIRRGRMVEALEGLVELQTTVPPTEPEARARHQHSITAAKADAQRSWCSFWDGAEKTLNSLIDPGVAFKESRSLDLSRIVDRRRVGALFTLIGTMVLSTVDRPGTQTYYKGPEDRSSQPDDELVHSLALYWTQRINKNHAGEILTPSEDMKKLARSNLDLAQASHRMDRVFGLLMDDKPGFTGHGKRSGGFLSQARICLHSPLWHLGSLTWFMRLRHLLESELVHDQRDAFTWLEERDLFIGGLLRKLPSPNASADLRRQIDALCAAEIALLGSNVMLGDSLRDIDAADSGRALGGLYLRMARAVLQVRARSPSDEASSEGAVPMRSFFLAAVFAFASLAAKRFLSYAIDIYESERSAERCLRHVMGSACICRADLMVMYGEALESAHATKDREGTLPGLEKPWPELKEILKAQERHRGDLDIEDVRRQATAAYQNAGQHFLAELEHYSKRYRFPHDAYYLHGNVSDDQVHHHIAIGIRARLWFPSDNPPNSAAASRALQKGMARLSHQQYGRYPRFWKRDPWLEDTCRVLELANALRPGRTYLDIRKSSEGEMEVRWLEVGEHPTAGELLTREDHDLLSRYFRVLEDGLAGAHPAKT